MRLAVTYLATGIGNEKGCLRVLETHAHAMALYSWFSDRDLRSCKSWFWTASRLQAKRMSLVERSGWSGATSTFRSLDVSCIDDPNLRYELGVIIAAMHARPESEPLSFISEQIGLMLQGAFDSAAAAAVRNLRIIEAAASKSIFVPDIAVLKAMHEGSDLDLELALKELCEASLSSTRRCVEDGFTEDLISSPATIYLRLCWAMGRTINVQDDLVPIAWMAEMPHDRYTLQFPDLEGYLIS